MWKANSTCIWERKLVEVYEDCSCNGKLSKDHVYDYFLTGTVTIRN